MLYSFILISLAVSISFQQDPSLDTNAWLEKYDKYRKVIEENTEITNEDNLTPEIRLHLITPKSRLWNAKTQDSPFKDSPFFAFYWAGGQGLTRYVLDHPEIVRGQRVLDLGSGCGATAIAAARCGAKSVTANDIDPLTCVGIDMNAKLNNVSLEIKKEDLIGRHGHFENWDCILIGDLFYEFSLMKTLVIMLRNARRRGKRIFLAEPCGIFRAYTLKDELRPVAQYHLPKVSSEILGYGMTVVSEFFV